MSSHLAIALSALTIAGWIDWRNCRIPNNLLLIALVCHLCIWVVLGIAPAISAPGAMIYALVVITVIISKRSFDLVNRHIGMGDIKIIGYWIIFVSPIVFWNRFILSLAFLAALTLIIGEFMKSREESVPFAPILLAATALTLIPL